MDPFTIITAVSSLAPIVTKWLGAGKTVQDVADKASDIAKIVTGKGDVEEALSAINQDPALAMRFQEMLLDQDRAYEEMYVQDKEDARKRDVALASTAQGNLRANWLVLFAGSVVTGMTAIIIFKTNLDEFTKTTITLVLGMFLNELKNIYSFEFGTTRRSRAKTDAAADGKTEL